MKITGLIYGLLLVLCMACETKTEKSEVEVPIDSFLIEYGGGKKNPLKQEFPEEVSLDKLKETEFILTLENKLSGSLNSIYAPTMLFAWQEIKDYYKSPIEMSATNSLDFKLINQSKTFQNSLNKGEYETTVNVGAGVEASAYFKKALPFAIPFHKQDEPLNFNGSKVKSFGLNYPDDQLLDYFQILYYLDQDHFAIKLYPADTSSEIFLAKGINLSGTFTDLLTSTNKWIETGNKEKLTKGKEWRYLFAEKDYLSIPAMKFNIGTNYSTLEGQSFTVASKPHEIVKIYQRTAFVFDEYGAIVESFAAIAVDSAGPPARIETPTPKKMIFDKPFVIFIKKKNSTNPYFAMNVMNVELMDRK